MGNDLWVVRMTYRNPAANTNDSPSQPGAFDAEPHLDERQRERSTFAACSGPCEQGRKPCPSPEACQVSGDDLGASVWFWAVLAIGMVSAGFLFAVLVNHLVRTL
jgi:hypothetical protein